jgi:uncharacterized protein (TIGR00369 family)
MTPSSKILQILPDHGSCFVCGKENPKSLGVQWQLMEDKSIFTKVTLDIAQQGPPGFAHGGASAALLDEAMGGAVWAAGYQVVAVNLVVNYHKPLPLYQEIMVEAQVENVEGRKVHASAVIHLEDGPILVSGHGLYLEAPQFFGEMWKYIKPVEN